MADVRDRGKREDGRAIVWTLEELFRDFRCTEREKLELRMVLHRYRYERALRELARYDMTSMLRA